MVENKEKKVKEEKKVVNPNIPKGAIEISVKPEDLVGLQKERRLIGYNPKTKTAIVWK